MDLPLDIAVVDPCDSDNTVSVSGLSWAGTETWTSDAITFTVDPATHISSVSDPVGVDCGAYTVELTATPRDDTAAPEDYTITTTAYSITINFNNDPTLAGTWDIGLVAYHTNYPGVSADLGVVSQGYAITVTDPCTS